MSRSKATHFYPRTDSGNAELFAAIYGEIVRFDHKQQRWLIWDGKRRRWAEDTQGKTRGLMKATARQRHEIAFKSVESEERTRQVRWALGSESYYRIDKALELAKSETPISDDGEGWDADPWLLGVANGVVDLRTGTLRSECPGDRITKHSPVQYDPSAKCLRFEQFVSEIFNGDSETIRFVQKAVGYSMTGVVTEQCLFCCYGSGANGKSTLFGVLHHILGLGEYAANLPFSALELQNRNNNDLAMLVGARFATAAETREGARLNEQRIKSLTGGDPITAKWLYHDPFTFQPTHKHWLAFNHKPVIADETEGMWRRVRFIPFTRQFMQKEQDRDLLDTLKAEAPGILAWAVKGCLLWQREGLGIPPAVAEATSAYREESDHLGQFTDECCICDAGASVPSTDLWRRYCRWVEENEEVPLSRQVFAERMEKRGFRRGRSGHEGTRTWEGIRLCADTLTLADTDSEKVLIKEGI
jgi:putative DNA primase/helicase